MKISTPFLASMLTYAGTLPLIASAALIFVPVTGFDPPDIAGTYSAVIISFLCGIHWAYHLAFPDKCPSSLLIKSNTIALIAWVSILMPHDRILFLLQALCFLYLLILDRGLYKMGIVPLWYYRLRMNVTIIVVGCLLILGLVS